MILRAIGVASCLAALSMGCTSPSGDASGAAGGGASTGAGPSTGAGVSTSSNGSSGSGGSCPEGQLCLAAPSPGFQLQSIGDMIQPGQDVEYCEVVQLPAAGESTPSNPNGDLFYVNRFEVAMTSYSHHLIVAAAISGSPTEKA